MTIRNVAVCLALAAGSYLASGLVNASPITQPPLVGVRSRALVVTPMPAAIPDSAPNTAPDGRLPERGRPLHKL